MIAMVGLPSKQQVYTESAVRIFPKNPLVTRLTGEASLNKGY